MSSLNLLEIIILRLGCDDLLAYTTKLNQVEVCYQAVTFGAQCLVWQLGKLELDVSELKSKSNISNIQQARELYTFLRPWKRSILDQIRVNLAYSDQENRIIILFQLLNDALRLMQIPPRHFEMPRIVHCLNEMLQRCQPMPRKRGRRWLEKILIAPRTKKYTKRYGKNKM